VNEIRRYLRTVRELRLRTRPTDLIYAGVEDLLLQHGRAFDPQPRPKRYPRMTPQYCFDNAYKLCLRFKGLHYAEGYAHAVIPIHHAWAVDERGRVVEATWDTPGAAYFGVVIPLDRVRAIRTPDNCSVLHDHGRDWQILKEPFVPTPVAVPAKRRTAQLSLRRTG
jgi:hypothetical protein